MGENKGNDLISSSALSISEIVENKSFRIPMYQRNYKWGAKTARKLAEDLVKSYQKQKEEKTEIKKSIGLLTLHQREDGVLDIIDGQQRLITLSIMFQVLGWEKGRIDLSFERDGEDRSRRNAIDREYDEKWRGSSPDVDRIMRNKRQIKACFDQEISDGDRADFGEYIWTHCVMLCSVIEREPEKEFMNLNAYKTKFSVCDYVRANLISLNSFYREELNQKNSLMASCLDQHSYKTAIAHLYDDILDIFYADSGCGQGGRYQNVYSVVRGSYRDPDLTKESRINLLFSIPDAEKRYFSDDDTKESKINLLLSREILDAEKGYFSDEINKNVEEWIQVLLRIACVKKLMTQLKEEMEDGHFSSAKEIDDYQKLKEKNFLDLIMNLNVEEERFDTITLAKLLKENSNVGYVLLKELGKTDQKLANRYLESFVYSGVNEATVTAAEEEDDIELPKMKEDEIIFCIQKTGQSVIKRFLSEQKQASDTSVVIAPVLDLEDRENLNFGGELPLEEGDTITVEELFAHKIKVPVIQRDYCMGARIHGEPDDFLEYLLQNFRDGKDVTASTILVSVEKESQDIYIFDGQQRLYTIDRLLKCCGETDDGEEEHFTFTGRKHGASRYSETAVKNLQEVFQKRTKEAHIDTEGFRDYLRSQVRFKVKVTETVSDAEQFFMDINGGVSLKNYEIFKSCLCERLVNLRQTDFIKEMENRWLVWFYDFRNTDREDETDAEELMEMRFMEFLCRFFIRRRLEKNGEKREPLPAFACIDSKSELVGKLQYLQELTMEDVSNIRCVMNALMEQEEEIRKPSESLTITFDCTDEIDLGTTAHKQLIGCYLLEQREEQKGSFMETYQADILHSFIDSLSDQARERLKKVYAWKDVRTLIELYDGDLLIRDCIQYLIEGTERKEDYPYARKRDLSMCFLGGYYVRKKILEGIPEEEIPVYYVPWEKRRFGENYIRANYLYDKVTEEYPDRKNLSLLNFIWTKRLKGSIKREDGTETYLVFSNQRKLPDLTIVKWKPAVEGYLTDTERAHFKVWLTNQTDAYFLNSLVVWELR